MTKKARVLKKGNYIHFLEKNSWEYIKRCNCSGIVIILAMTEKGDVILTEQFRIPVDRYVIEFPAGLVNDHKQKKNESPPAAAKRELLEETGYQARHMHPLIAGPAGSGTSADVMTFVLAEGVKKVADGGGDKTETIKVHLVPIDKIDRWLKSKGSRGFHIDPKIYAGLYFLKGFNQNN